MKRSAFAHVTLSIALFAGTVLALGGFTSPAGAADSGTTVVGRVAPQPAMSTDYYERSVRYWINQKRKARGLRPLREQTCTDNAAERWGSYLSANLEFFHQSMEKLLDRCGARWAGETLAKGPVSPKQMVSLWMHSTGHRAILLSKSPRRIGIGAYPDVNGYWVVAADFTRF